jgi:hypothetical protein
VNAVEIKTCFQLVPFANKLRAPAPRPATEVFQFLNMFSPLGVSRLTQFEKQYYYHNPHEQPKCCFVHPFRSFFPDKVKQFAFKFPIA